MLEPTYIPRLRHCTLLAGEENEPITMIVGKSYFQISTITGGRDRFLKVKSLFDGRNTIKEIADKTAVPIEDISEIVSGFKDIGILRSEIPIEMIKTYEFIAKVTDSCDMWQKQIGFHRLFSLLDNESCRKEVFIGWLLETYHYVKSASKHIAVAISNCKNEEWRELLVSYFTEEYDHSGLYLESLIKMGLAKEDVINAHPIIGTMSLINMLCEIGRQSSLSYIACTSLFEAKKNDFESAKKKFLEISKIYGFDLDVVNPIIEHMRMDVAAGHTSLLSEALSEYNVIDAKEAHYAVNCVHDLKHAFDQFHDQIIQYYSDVSNYVPRLKVDYFSL